MNNKKLFSHIEINSDTNNNPSDKEDIKQTNDNLSDIKKMRKILKIQIMRKKSEKKRTKNIVMMI